MSTQTTVVRTVRHARWVRVLYHPAFSLAFGSSRTTGPMALYQSYIGWWMQRPEQP